MTPAVALHGRDPGRTLTLVGLQAVRLNTDPAPSPVMPLPRRKSGRTISFAHETTAGVLWVTAHHDGIDWSSVWAFSLETLERVYLHRLPAAEMARVYQMADEKLEAAS